MEHGACRTCLVPRLTFARISLSRMRTANNFVLLRSAAIRVVRYVLHPAGTDGAAAIQRRSREWWWCHAPRQSSPKGMV